MQAVLRGAIATPRTTIALIVVLVTLVALALPTRASAELSSSGVELRIAAQRLDDGRTEFALQIWDGERWGERVLPRSRFFPTTARVDAWLNSSVLDLDSGHTVRISAKRLDDDRIEFALQQNIGGEWVDRLLPRPRFFPANVAAGRWLYSGRLEPVGYVPIQTAAPRVQGATSSIGWWDTDPGRHFATAIGVYQHAAGHGVDSLGGQVRFEIRCDAPHDRQGLLGIRALGFQSSPEVTTRATVTYQLDANDEVEAEWGIVRTSVGTMGGGFGQPRTCDPVRAAAYGVKLPFAGRRIAER